MGHFKSPQITVSPILNRPENIIQFCCGYDQSYFLDSEKNVFSVGANECGQLGLGHDKNKNTLNKIPKIPPIQSISVGGSSGYLLDFEGNVWSFGDNELGQLGHGDEYNRDYPKKIKALKNIKQLSSGCGSHFFAKDSKNKIFVTGDNETGQLGTNDCESLAIPTKIKPKYFPIWGNHKIINELSHIPTMNWREDEKKTLEMIQSKIEKVKFCLDSNNKIKQEFPQNSFESWIEVYDFLNELEQINSKLNEKQDSEKL